MSAVSKIIEGSWEEVLGHAKELAGHRLKVIVMDEESIFDHHPAFDTSSAAVNEWIERLRQRGRNGVPIRLGEDSRDAIYEDYLK